MKFLVLVLAMFVVTANAATLKNKQFVDVSSNEVQVVKAVYDFSKDTGAVASYEAIEATGDVIIDSISIEAIDALTSAGGTVVVDLGYTGQTTAFLANTATTALEAGDLAVPANTFVPVKLAKGSKVLMEIKTQAATAGKFVITAVMRKFGL